MSKVSSIIDVGNVILLNQIMRISSGARTFNNIMLRKGSACPKILINRVKQICSDNNLDFVDVVTSSEQIRHRQSKILPYVIDGQDGMIDSIRVLLNCKTPTDISFLQLLLKPYFRESAILNSFIIMCLRPTWDDWLFPTSRGDRIKTLVIFPLLCVNRA